LKFTAGWDNFSEPLDFKKSKITYSVNAATKKITFGFSLAGATPSKLYQVGIGFFRTTFPAEFGQFFNHYGAGNCPSQTKQGVTKTATGVELGVVTTDIHGNGTLTAVVGPVPSGSYEVEFFVHNGAGCWLSGGAGNQTSDCEGDFQSPGPTFGDTATITAP
jgi:hypothetical protein